MSTITWTASNNSSYLNGERTASSRLAAIRAARAYIRGELHGEGSATVFEDGEPVAQTERSMFTGYRWITTSV